MNILKLIKDTKIQKKPITNQVINVQKKIQIHQQFEIQDLLGKG